jgi:hypothetical protein
MPDFNRTLRKVMTQTDGTAFVVSLAAYTANDSVGGQGMVATGVGGGLTLLGVSIRDDAVQNEPYIIHMFRSQASTIADADAMALTTADGDLEVGTVTVAAGDYVTANGGAYSKAYKPIPAQMAQVDESSAGTFYVYLECTATPDYAAVGDLKIEFVYWAD